MRLTWVLVFLAGCQADCHFKSSSVQDEDANVCVSGEECQIHHPEMPDLWLLTTQ